MNKCIGAIIYAVFVFDNLFSSGCAKPNVVKSENEENWKDPFPIPTTGRLPTWIKPFHYDLKLNVFLDNATYNGFVSIDFKVVNETNKVVLNALDLVMFNETCKIIWKKTGNELVVKNQTYDVSLQFYVIHLNEVLDKDEEYQIQVSFRGTLNDKLVGFYLSTYKNADGSEVRVASTQFSPTDARRAFPCFDEPVFKATFKISIERDAGVNSLSNMPLASSLAVSEKENRFFDSFLLTPKMSTYLVGFLVSDFSFKSSDFLNRTEFKIWCRDEALDQVDYALEISPKLLQFLEGYFDSEYPLPKLDMAAIPDFKFGGMENWGLIMYRESALLYDPLVSTVSRKRNLISVIAHEISHMWFGNLVTPKWWSELWLKEGFAVFMAYMAIDNVEPNWKMMDFSVRDSMYNALKADSLLSSHPINVEVNNPDSISEIFDIISYNKGASIIRMMYHFLSEEVYKRGMRNYLKTLQYDNSVQEDLWRFLTQSWNESESFDPSRTVQTIMNTWTLQEGYPVVNITRNTTHLFLSQERFLLGVKSNNSSENIVSQEWWIPISLVHESQPHFNETQPKIWMQPGLNSTTLLIEENKWFIINVQKTGFYRVNYDDSNWLRLKEQLLNNFSLIHRLNREQIIDDAFNLARIGYVEYDLPLGISDYMKMERDITVWATFLSNFKYILNMARNENETIEFFYKFLQELIVPLYNKTGFIDSPLDSYDIQELRILSTEWACHVGYKPCIETANKLFYQWLDLPFNMSSDIITNNIKPTVLCYGIKSASLPVWNQVFDVYIKSNSQTEKAEILQALGCTENSEIVTRFLKMASNSSSGIIKQDISLIYNGVSETKTGERLAWKNIQENWNFLIEYLGRGSAHLWYILKAPTKNFNSKEHINELKEFEKKYKENFGSTRQTLDQILEEAEINKVWMEKYFPSVLNFMRKKIINKENNNNNNSNNKNNNNNNNNNNNKRSRWMEKYFSIFFSFIQKKNIN